MIRIIIIEDEAVAARKLERILSKIQLNTEVIASIDSVKNAINLIPKLDADLILMDIHLSDGNTFQLFENIKISTPIIFTTAFDQYTLKAFKQNSIDYLLKPIDQKELELAIFKYKNIFKKNEPELTQDYQDIIEILKNKHTSKKRFLVQVGKKMLSINIENIAFFFVENKTTYLKKFDGKKYIVDNYLAQLETQIDPEIFYRVNRQFLVNSQAIESIYYLSSSRLKVNLVSPFEEEILVTIDKISKFKKWLNR